MECDQCRNELGSAWFTCGRCQSFRLEPLRQWMGERGVRRLKVDFIEIELSETPTAAPKEATPPVPMTEEEVRKAVLAKRRQRYERELGRKLSDDELGMLP